MTSKFIATQMGYSSARFQARQKLVQSRHRPRHKSFNPLPKAFTFDQLAKLLKQAGESSRRKHRNVLFETMKNTVGSYIN